jgi:hypothetical protein
VIASGITPEAMLLAVVTMATVAAPRSPRVARSPRAGELLLEALSLKDGARLLAEMEATEATRTATPTVLLVVALMMAAESAESQDIS